MSLIRANSFSSFFSNNNNGDNIEKLKKFAENLYDSDILMEEGDKKKCFLRGSFIFEDEGAKVFKLLKNTGAKRVSNVFHNKWIIIGKTTHMEIKKKVKKKGLKIRSLILKDDDDDDKWHDDVLEQYEFEPKDEMKKNTPFTFQCNPTCRKDPNGVECNGLEDPKNIFFMYHFQISDDKEGTDDKEGSYNNAKGYTFLKFEGHSTYSPKHFEAARKRYSEGIDANPGNLVQLREDCNRKKDNNKCFYFKKGINNENTLQEQAENPEEKKSVVNLDYKPYEEMKRLNNKESPQIESSLSAYNEKLRTGDEFFVPQVLTDKLLDDLETGNSFGGKRKPRKTKRRKSKKVRKVRKTKSKK
jgi:hypothetical protein